VAAGTVILLLTASARGENNGNEPGFRAGAAAADISPTVVPFQLRSGPSEFVHDPLHVRAVAFENGDGRAAIAVMDAIGVGRDSADRAKQLVAEATGWKPEEMLVCATHTHSAPKGGDSTPGRKAYEKRRFEGIVEALTRAIDSLQPAEVGFASDEEPDEVYNRRWFRKPGTMRQNPLGQYDEVWTNSADGNHVEPAGPTDPEVCVVDVRTRKGRPLGLLANYALHYVGHIPQKTNDEGETMGMASADYFGEFARLVPYRVGRRNPPENFVAMMSNGASGDINNIDFDRTRPPRAPFEQIRVVATKTADAAWRAVEKIEEYDEAPVVAMVQREVTLDYRTMSDEEVQRAVELMNLPRKEREKIHRWTTRYARNTIQYAESDRSEDVIIQAIRIGDQAIVSLPFEVFVEIGLEIKEKSPFPHTFLVELANGSYGYLPTPRHHELGGYETWIGTAKFAEDSSEVLTEELLEMLGELDGIVKGE